MNFLFDGNICAGGDTYGLTTKWLFYFKLYSLPYAHLYVSFLKNYKFYVLFKADSTINNINLQHTIILKNVVITDISKQYAVISFNE